MRIVSTLIVVIAVATNSIAKDFSDSTRERYIKRFPDHFFVWPVLKQRSTSLEIENLPNKNQKLTYKPNGNVGLGFGMYLFEIGFELTFSVAPKSSSQYLYGHSRVKDLQANILGKHWGLDVFTQNYNGFYQSDKNIAMPAKTPYPQRPDISTWNTGVNGIYVFNKNKYSLRAAYNFAERQIRSGGSFLMTGTLNTFSFRADSAIYGKHYENIFGASTDFKKMDYTTFSIAPGYAHTFVYRSIFFNASLSIGPAQDWVYFQTATATKHETTLNTFVDFRLALGYNSSRFFSGVSYISQSRNIKIEQIQVNSANSTFKLVIGYRFKEFGILKKKISDLFPAKNK
jgi:hypothetical protein